jgi:predicted anti-sigma-YlaC factor YlaD
MRQLAVNQLGDALAAGGDTFAADEDPELIGSALPFSLKLMESVLAETPNHRGMLVAAARGFTQYSYAWVDTPALERDATDPAVRAEHLRARRLYLRARDYGLRALEGRIEHFRTKLADDPRLAVSTATKSDVPALYWTAAAWGLAIGGATDDAELLADLPAVEALITRAAELDPDYEAGAIDTFLIRYEASRASIAKGSEQRARSHFSRAVAQSHARLATPYVAAAEALSVPAQNRKEFDEFLNEALAINPDAEPRWRLENILAQRRARWLAAHADDLFADETNEAGGAR